MKYASCSACGKSHWEVPGAKMKWYTNSIISGSLIRLHGHCGMCWFSLPPHLCEGKKSHQCCGCLLWSSATRPSTRIPAMDHLEPKEVFDSFFLKCFFPLRPAWTSPPPTSLIMAERPRRWKAALFSPVVCFSPAKQDTEVKVFDKQTLFSYLEQVFCW